jgi:hypothetical protein
MISIGALTARRGRFCWAISAGIVAMGSGLDIGGFGFGGRGGFVSREDVDAFLGKFVEAGFVEGALGVVPGDDLGEEAVVVAFEEEEKGLAAGF